MRAVGLGQDDVRTAGHSDDVVLPEALAATYVDHFKPPTTDEGPLLVVR